MNRFRPPPHGSLVPAVALSALLLCAAAARAEDQPKPAPAEKSAPKAAAKPAAQPNPTVTPKKEAEGILGKQVYGPHGADMGLVTNVLVDHAGNPIAVVVDFGGFLGMGSRRIAIDWHLMQFHPGDTKMPITLSLQRDQLKAAPAYEPDKPPKIVGAPAPHATPNSAPTAPSSNDHIGK